MLGGEEEEEEEGGVGRLWLLADVWATVFGQKLISHATEVFGA